MIFKINRVAPFLVLAGILLAGCSSSPDPRFYILEGPQTQSTSTARGSEELSIFIAPIVLSDYLKRNEIISRPSNHRVSIAEYDRWAEPLDQTIATVLTQNLAEHFGSGNVTNYYSNFNGKSDVTIRVHIVEFGPTGDRVALKATWEVSDTARSRPQVHSQQFSESFSDGDYQSISAAMSRALARLSDSIVGTIR